MPISHTVWSLDKKEPLKTASLVDEKELEQLLKDNIEILNKDWLMIGNQVKTAAGKFIDILCIDHDGDMVVVELKKDLTPRDVTAQVIDYAASVSKMTAEEIAQVYLDYTNGEETLNDAYSNKYGAPLDETNINQNVKMVIIAAKMDDGTERIIRFLRETYSVDINILFFNVFQCNEERLISRAWFEEDIETALPGKITKKATWNKECYVSFGAGSRNWDDAMEYGFISGGGGSWYSRSLSSLCPGDRVWAYIPQTGYVGVGIVTEPVQAAKDTYFVIDGEKRKLEDLSLRGNYLNSSDDPDRAEYIVKVDWIKAVPSTEALKELGFFANQNTVCRPTSEKWRFTIERLKKCWEIE